MLFGFILWMCMVHQLHYSLGSSGETVCLLYLPNLSRRTDIWTLGRVNPLLARGKCVVSEMGSDPELDDMYKSAVVFASYQDLVSCIMSLLAEGALFFSVSAFPLTQAVSYTCAVQNFLWKGRRIPNCRRLGVKHVQETSTSHTQYDSNCAVCPKTFPGDVNLQQRARDGQRFIRTQQARYPVELHNAVEVWAACWPWWWVQLKLGQEFVRTFGVVSMRGKINLLLS